MNCLSLAWLEQLLVWAVIVGALILILRIIIPWALQFFGAAGGVLAQVIDIVIKAVIAILVIYIVFALISCLIGSGHLSLMPPR